MARKPSRVKAPPSGPAAPAGFSGPTVFAPGLKSAADLEIDRAVEAARQLYYVQEFAKARDLLKRVLAARPGHYEALRLLGDVHSRGFEDIAEALDALRRARAARPADAAAWVQIAELRSKTGASEDALAEARAILAEHPAAIGAFRLIAELAPASVEDALLARMSALADQGAAPAQDRGKLMAALGRVLERRGEIDAAFGWFRRANQQPGGTHHAAALDATLAGLRARLTPEYFRHRRGFGLKDARNVFVIGMPRSGSTLLEQVAMAHPRVDSCGESNVMLQLERFLMARRAAADASATDFDFVAGLGKADIQIAANRYFKIIGLHLTKPGATRILNKSLVNFERILLLKTLFPNALFLHSFRHPLDTLLSCYKQDFMAVPYATRFDWLAHFFNYYMGMIEFWAESFPDAVIHVCHEDFVTDFAAAAPRLIQALGLPWDEACARPHERRGVVYTASYAQVRQPVNASAFGRWRKYEKHLAPLIEALGGLERIEARYQRFRALSI